MSGTLYVVATPIGNLEDITLRALRVLREADVIAAEDTRRTARLLAHYAITTPMLSFHEHNTRTRVPQLITRLQGGASVALVTDAGTPGVSDPGVELVAVCRSAGIRVEPVPGASAPLAAAVASGFPLDRLTLLGFAPSKAKDRKAFISEINNTPGTVTFFEAPHRIKATLVEMTKLLGQRQICLARELTKAHEELICGTAAEIIGRTTDPRGEYTVVVGPGSEASPEIVRPSDADIAAQFGFMTEMAGLSRRAAIAELAARHRIPAREIYGIIEKQKNYGQ